MDFLGTTNPASVITSVTEGVVTTITTYAPLFVLVGVAIAFTIAAFLVRFIFLSVQQRETGADFDEKTFNAKADELERFYSRRGRNSAPWDFIRLQNKRR